VLFESMSVRANVLRSLASVQICAGRPRLREVLPQRFDRQDQSPDSQDKEDNHRSGEEQIEKHCERAD